MSDRQEVDVAYFKVSHQKLAGRTEYDHGKPQSWNRVPVRCEPRISVTWDFRVQICATFVILELYLHSPNTSSRHS